MRVKLNITDESTFSHNAVEESVEITTSTGLTIYISEDQGGNPVITGGVDNITVTSDKPRHFTVIEHN